MDNITPVSAATNLEQNGAMVKKMMSASLSQQSILLVDDEENILNSPDGLSDPKKAVEALEEVASQIKEEKGRLDVPWGDVYRINYNGIDLPGNGASGFYGVVRVAWGGGSENGITNIGGGDSWVGVVEFGEKVKAKVLLSYGNSSQPDSKNNGDQLQLFSDMEMRNAFFYREDVLANAQRIEVLENGKFIEK